MKTKILILFTLMASFLFAETEKGMTNNFIPDFSSMQIKYAKSGKPEIPESTNIKTQLNREGWETVDSTYIDKIIGVDEYFGFKFNSEENFLEKITNINSICDIAKLALKKAPLWLRPSLEIQFASLNNEKQNFWANVIMNATDPYIDEISFAIAYLPGSYLQSSFGTQELLIENAELIYTYDAELSYVEIVDYGNSNSDDYYSTAIYTTKDENGMEYQFELDKEEYYWNVVMPRVGVEIPAYIDPTEIESNSSHNNNITAPGIGVFWRNWLYYHTDEGQDENGDNYENLRTILINSDVLYDPTNKHAENSVMGNLTEWINDALVFGSEQERPHQPVRIYRKHLGRCGEHADLRSAIAKTALIPIRKIATYSTDHVWNEFKNDSEWIHWDENEMDYPMMYEWGWGKVHASVLAERTDQTFTSVSDKYSGGSASLNVYVVDANNNPVDGAKVLVAANTSGTWSFDNLAITDNNGYVNFVVGESLSYAVCVDSNVEDTSLEILVENVEDGFEGDFTIQLGNVINQIEYTEIPTPEDSVDDYKLIIEYEVPFQHSIDNSAFSTADININMSDIAGSKYNYSRDLGKINFFMMNENEFSNYNNGTEFSSYNSSLNSENGSVEFAIPSTEDNYTMWENSNSVKNSQRVVGYISLLRYDEFGGSASISGNVSELFDSENIENAVVSAGMYSTITDANGNYNLEIYPGNYSIFCEASGFTTSLVEDILVTNEETFEQDFMLMEISYNPQNINAVEQESGNAYISWNAPLESVGNRDLISYDISVIELDNEYNVLSVNEIAIAITDNSFEDSTWPILPAGMYKYIVQANYSSGINSPGGFSNIIFNDMTADVNILLSSNSNDDLDATEITFVNVDQNPSHTYSVFSHSEETTVSKVWKGLYSVSIEKAGFEKVQFDDFEVSVDTLITVEMIELLENVDGLGVFGSILEWGNVESDRSFVEYNVFVDDLTTPVFTTNNEMQFDLSEYGTGYHLAGVQAVFTTGSSEIVSIGFENGESLPLSKIAYYNFDNLESPYSDDLGNYSGSAFGNVQIVESNIGGNAIEFDGSSAYVDCGDIVELDGATAYSMGGWFYFTDWNQWRKLITKDAKIGIITQSGNLGGKFQACQRNPENTMRGDGQTLVRLNEWHHIYTTFDGTQPDNKSKLKLYADGIQIELEFFGEIAETTMEDLNNVLIGGFGNNSIKGKIDEVNIWNRAITSKEIEHMYLEKAPYWGTLEGNVSSNIDGNLQDAKVSFGLFNANTDADGNYSIEIPATRYNVNCYLDGYDILTEDNYKVSVQESNTLDFEYIFQGLVSETTTEKMFLGNSYPNPFSLSGNNRSTNATISYFIPERSNVVITIYNILGQKVSTLLNEELASGYHEIRWDGKDSNKRIVASGIYFLNMKAGNGFNSTKKMMLIK